MGFINSSIFGGNNSIYWSHGAVYNGTRNLHQQTIKLYHIDGYFVVKFANAEERDMVLCSGPHHLLRRPVIMKPWVPEFNFKEEILTTIPLWVKLPNLPLNCWNSVVLSKIVVVWGIPCMQKNVQLKPVKSLLPEF
ncbi:hypothetical protein MTR67_048101 [Solanum verrucosum]|uniref:DUF4283 domain-containing protein n=1 Tax=Solanum verrucosum TaxID=315347 RepID=A0AAF0V0Z8_SOLVR|nr:hypothetical protein MTR67_048101 [Solanum verrucosum]